MVRYSIIIPNFNGIRYLSPCLDSILFQSFTDFEIIIVDNASIDDSVKLISEEYPNVNLILNLVNRRFAGGCNDGVSVASGEYLLFLNTDTVLPSSFLMFLDEAVQKYPGYGMYAPKMMYPDGRINSTGICLSLSGAAWDRGMGEQDSGQYDRSEEVFGPCGGAALYLRSVFLAIGGFDDDFFLFMEDVDLAFRAHLAGWRCRYVPEVVVYHHHGGSAGVGSDITVYYGNRNILWYPVKDFPWWLLVLALPWIIGRTIGVIGYYARKGKGRVVIKAKWDGFKGIPGIIRKRRGNNLKSEFITFIRFLKIWADFS